MRWAKRLKRALQIDVEICLKYGGTVEIIECTRDGSTLGLLALRANRPCVLACAEVPPVIEQIRSHLRSKGLPVLWPESRAPAKQRATLLQ